MPQENVTTKFKVDISDLKSNISEANKLIKLANAEFKAASAGMEDWSKSATGIEAKLKQLASVLDAQKSKLSSYEQQLARQKEAYTENGNRADQLREKLQDLANNGVSKTSEEYKKYQSELASVEKEQISNQKAIDNLKVTILNQQAAVKTTEAEIKKYDNTLDDLEKENGEAEETTKDLTKSLDDVDDKAKEASDGFTVMKAAIANVISDFVINGLKKLSNAVVDIGKQALSNYSDFEQLEGGVEKLFGTGGKSLEDYAKSVGKSTDQVKGEYNKLINAQQAVIDNANNAYKTAGMDANTYMETVTGFSASLISGLNGDTQKAAKIADTAIRDMSDNANTFGTDISSIQAAYQGFAKGNFTLLDNLKLGYGGTKEEMLRLVKEAGVVDQSVKSIDDVSFDKIIEGINKTQQRIGIAGTTAREAGQTIEGSVNAAKSAWQNLLTGLADENANMDLLINNFIDSILTAASNIIPRVQTIISGVGTLISKFAEVIVPQVVQTLVESTPVLISGVFSMINGLIKALPKIIKSLASALPKLLPQIINGIVSVFVTLSETDMLSPIIEALPDIIMSIADALISNLDILISAAINLALGIVNAADEIIKTIVPMIPEIIIKISEALISSLPTLLSGVWKLLIAILSVVNDWWSARLKGIENAWEEIKEKFSGWIASIKEFFSGLWNSITNIFDNVPTWFAEKFSQAWTKIREKFKSWGQFWGNLWNIIKTKFTNIGTKIGSAISNSVKSGINRLFGWVENTVNKIIKILNSAIDFINQIPGLNIGYINYVELPRLEKGGILKKGQTGILEGTGAEAVVPLDQNKGWIRKVASDMLSALNVNAGSSLLNNNISNNQTTNFTQNIYAPQQPSRIELYRQTKNLLQLAESVKGV